jgi:hypothetical protein
MLIRANAEKDFRNGGCDDTEKGTPSSAACSGERTRPRVQFPASRRKTLFGETLRQLRDEDAHAPQTSRLGSPFSSDTFATIGRRPGRNGLSAVSEAKGQALRTLAFAPFRWIGSFASAIWKFLSAIALQLYLSKRAVTHFINSIQSACEIHRVSNHNERNAFIAIQLNKQFAKIFC